MNTLQQSASVIGPGLALFQTEEGENRKPSEATLSALRDAGLLRLFLPKSLGGLEQDPLTTAKLVEEISLHNTCAGWSMMVANVSAWWASLLSEQGIEELLHDGPDTPLAGAFHPPMRAVKVDKGYRVNGRSPLASNVSRSKWIFVTALVTEGDQVKVRDGIPEVIGVFMKTSACQIKDTWHTTGMRGTDSNDVVADDIFVPDHLQHRLAPGLPHNRYYNGPLYDFPAIGAGVACLIAPVALATARNAVQELKAMAKKIPFGSMVSIRDRGSVQKKLALAEAYVQAGRAYLFQTIEECWKKTLSGNGVTIDDRATLLLATTHVNQTCCKAVDLIYSAAGSSAIYTSSKIAFHFANAQVIRQHGFANDSRYETAGQVYLGLPPDLPVLAF